MLGIEEALDQAHYTFEARRAMGQAVEAVRQRKGNIITPDHLALGLLQANVRASQYVTDFGIDPKALAERIAGSMPPPQGKSRAEYPMDPRTKAILRVAYSRAVADHGRKMTSVDILIGVLRDEGSDLARLLVSEGLSARAVERAFEEDPDRARWSLE